MSKQKAQPKVPFRQRVFKDTVFEKQSPWEMFLQLIDRIKGRKTYFLPSFTRRFHFHSKVNNIKDRHRKNASSILPE